MHHYDLCPFVFHVSVRVILGEAVRYVLSIVWSTKCAYSSSIKPISISLSRSLPPFSSPSLSLSLSLSKTDHLQTSLASHVGVKGVPKKGFIGKVVRDHNVRDDVWRGVWCGVGLRGVWCADRETLLH